MPLPQVRSDWYVNATLLAQESGTRLGYWLHNKATQERLKLMPSDYLQQQYGKGCNQATWVHPDLVDDLRHWCQLARHRTERRSLQGRAGYVYVVTSAVINIAKIGCWSGDIHGLRSRYVTPYGPELQLEVNYVKDMIAAEAQLHKQFAIYNVGGELFDKTHIERYRDALRSA